MLRNSLNCSKCSISEVVIDGERVGGIISSFCLMIISFRSIEVCRLAISCVDRWYDYVVVSYDQDKCVREGVIDVRRLLGPSRCQEYG